MSALAINLDDLHEPTAEDISSARDAARELSRFKGAGKSLNFVLKRNDGDLATTEPITVPVNIFNAIIKMLTEMGNGNAIAIVPVQAELTTQQAADLLNVSRPHLIKLLNEGKLPHRMAGTHRKIAAHDVQSYKDKIDHARREALARMVAADEDLGLYDDEQVGARD